MKTLGGFGGPIRITCPQHVVDVKVRFRDTESTAVSGAVGYDAASSSLVITQAGSAVALIEDPRAADLLQCLRQGFTYEAEVMPTEGGWGTAEVWML